MAQKSGRPDIASKLLSLCHPTSGPWHGLTDRFVDVQSDISESGHGFSCRLVVNHRALSSMLQP